MNQILRSIRVLYRSYRNENGTWKLDRYSPLAKMALSNDSYKFFGDFLDFVMTGGILSDTTMIYIQSIEDNLQDAIRLYNADARDFEKISPKKASNHFYYDAKRLHEFFPDDMIIQIQRKKADLEVCRALLQSAVNKKLGKSQVSELCVLNLPTGICTTVPDEKELDDFFKLIAPYSNKAVRETEKKIHPDTVKYLNYVLNKVNLSAEEKLVVNRCKALLAKGE